MTYEQLRERYFSMLFMYYKLNKAQRESEFGRVTIREIRKTAELMNQLLKSTQAYKS